MSRPLDWRVGGTLLGLLGVVAVGLQGPIGVSTSYVTTEAAAVALVARNTAESNAYWAKTGTALTPEWILVVGIVLGGFIAARLGRSRSREAVPATWRERYGSSEKRRFWVAFTAGILLLFGARLAGGCTSGHVISGISQLAVSGMVFALGMFLSGISTARWLYGRTG